MPKKPTKPRTKAKAIRKKPPSSASSAPSVAKSSAAAAKRQDALRRYLAGQPLTSHQTRLVCDYIRPLLDRVPQKLVVDLLATTRKMLGEWAEQGAPRNDDATWPLGRLLKWVKKRWGAHRRGAGIEEADGQLPLEMEPRRRLEAAQAEIAEIKRDEMRGRLVPREELVAEREYADRLTMEFSVGLADIERQAARTFGGEKGVAFLVWLGRSVTKVRERLARLRG